METIINMKEAIKRKSYMKRGSSLKKVRSASDDKAFEAFIKDEQFFMEVLRLMEKQERSPFEKQMILLLLSTMQSLLQLVKEVNDNFIGLLYSISGVIKHEKVESNRILFKTGDEADKFYILLKGTVAVAQPIEEEICMSEEEYILYLAKLKVYHEKDLLNQCIMRNQEVFPVDIEELDSFLKAYYVNFLSSLKSQDIISQLSLEEGGAIDEYDESIPYSFYICTNRILKMAVELAETHQSQLRGSVRRTDRTFSKIGLYPKVDSMTDYIKRSYPIIRDKKADRKQVIIFKYTFRRFLKSGDKFGERALNLTSNRRTASIITVEDCHLGALDDDSFKHSLKDLYERVKKSNVNFLLAQPIFAHCNRVLFEKNLCSCFTHEKGVRNQIILQEGGCSDMVYFLKEGEFEVFSYKSLKEIDFLITHLGGEGILDLENYGDKILTKRFIKISIIKNNEVVGLSDYRYNEKFIFRIRCISNKCEYFKIEYENFKKILHDSTMRKNFQKILYFKKQYMLHRLIDIREMQLKFLQMLASSEANNPNKEEKFPSAFMSFDEGKMSTFTSKPKFLKVLSFKKEVDTFTLKKENLGVSMKKHSRNPNMKNLTNCFENFMKANTVFEIHHQPQPHIRSTIRNLTNKKNTQNFNVIPKRRKSNPDMIVIMELNETNNNLQSQEEKCKSMSTKNNTIQKINFNFQQALSKGKILPETVEKALAQQEESKSKNILTLESTERSSDNTEIKYEFTTRSEPQIKATHSKNFVKSVLSYTERNEKKERAAQITQPHSSSKKVVDLLSMDNFNRIYNSELYFRNILFQQKKDTQNTIETKTEKIKKTKKKLSFLESDFSSFNPESKVRSISNFYNQRNSVNYPKYHPKILKKSEYPPEKKFDIMITDNSIKKYDPLLEINELLSPMYTQFQTEPNHVQKFQSESKKLKEVYSNVLRRNKKQLSRQLK